MYKIFNWILKKISKKYALLDELNYYLQIREESDDGRIFRPNWISSYRALDGERMNQILHSLSKYR